MIIIVEAMKNLKVCMKIFLMQELMGKIKDIVLKVNKEYNIKNVEVYMKLKGIK